MNLKLISARHWNTGVPIYADVRSARAFPGEVESGSPSGNAQNKESGAVLCFRQNQNGSSSSDMR